MICFNGISKQDSNVNKQRLTVNVQMYHHHHHHHHHHRDNTITISQMNLKTTHRIWTIEKKKVLEITVEENLVLF